MAVDFSSRAEAALRRRGGRMTRSRRALLDLLGRTTRPLAPRELHRELRRRWSGRFPPAPGSLAGARPSGIALDRRWVRAAVAARGRGTLVWPDAPRAPRDPRNARRRRSGVRRAHLSFALRRARAARHHGVAPERHRPA